MTDREVVSDRYLKTTPGADFGDSGGPVFHSGVIVAITSWGESMRSTSPAYSYRMDAQSAQDFVNDCLTGVLGD